VKDSLISKNARIQQFPLTGKYIYFDNSATTLTPRSVVNAQRSYYEEYCVNIERGNYRLAQRADKAYESSRAQVARLLLGCLPQEFLFTRNFTESANLVAYALEHPLADNGRKKRFSSRQPLIAWHRGDSILCTVMEHHSNFLPWMRLAKRLNLEFNVVTPDSQGVLQPDAFIRAVNKKTRFVAFQHVSNAFGVIHPVGDIVRSIKKKNPQALIFIDGAQAAGHMPVDVNALGCDFYAFSGHKGPLGPKGTGGLMVKDALLAKFHPFCIGGGTVLDVTLRDYTLKNDYQRFDGGTPYIPGLIGLGAAAEYLSRRIGLAKIKAHERFLVEKLIKGMRLIDGVQLYGPAESKMRAGIVTFNLKKWLCHDVSMALDEKYHILTRAGHHCCIPAMRFFDILKTYGGNVRVSLHCYNTEREVEVFLEALRELAG